MPGLNIHQLLMTRFNIRTAGTRRTEPQTPEWIEERFELFSRYCAASVASQTEEHFDWIIFCDEDTSPGVLERIRAFDRRIRIALCTANVVSPQLPGDRAATADAEPRIRPDGTVVYPTLGVAPHVRPGTDVVIATRLDNDDALNRHAMRRVRDHLDRFIASGHAKWVYNPQLGYKLDHQTNRLFPSAMHNGPFLTLFERISDGQAAVGPYVGNHSDMYEHFPSYQDDGARLWVMVLHGGNVKNKLLHGDKPTEVAIETLRDDFTVRPRGGSRVNKSPGRIVYDLALFERLNEEYRDRPIVDVAKIWQRRAQVAAEPERRHDATKSLLKAIRHDVDLAGKVVLELGCGHGLLTSALLEHAHASRAIGVDEQPFTGWSEHTDPRLSFLSAHLSQTHPIAPNSIDTIISTAGFERVEDPLRMLAALYDIVRDDGEVWLRTNVYTAINASRRYTEVHFPWPHLLFSDEVCEQFYRRQHNHPNQRFAWINRMTVAHYVQAAHGLGFKVRVARRRITPIDVPFYLRFIDQLGRYPALDLETSLLTLVLRKSSSGGDDEPAKKLDVDYVARQRHLDLATARHREEHGSATPEQFKHASGDLLGHPSLPPQQDVDIAALRIAQTKVPLQPYDEFVVQSSAARSSADEVIDRGWAWELFPTIHLRPPLAWDEVCTHRSHAFNLHAWTFLSEVLRTYDRTQAFRYLDFAIQLALDWAATYPTLQTDSVFAWNDMATGIRASRLAYIIDAAVRHDAVPDTTLARLVAAALLHARAFAEDHRFVSRTNHGFFFAAGQLALARRLPTLPGMNQAAIQAEERLRIMVDTQFTSEGGHREHSPEYHVHTLTLMHALRRVGLLPDTSADQLIDRLEEALAWFVMPNGRLTPIGDSYPGQLTLTSGLVPRNQALRLVLSGAEDGAPPRASIRAFPETGYVVIRDPWPSNPANAASGCYLAQISAYHSNVHKHLDDLSFVWYDRGQELLTDAGAYSYDYNDPNRIYVQSMSAHNTVTVDRTPWIRQRFREKPYGAAPQRSGEAAGVFYIETEVEHHMSVRHARVLLLRPGEWLIVFDWLAGHDETPHEFTQRFLFAPGLDAEPDGSTLTLRLPDSGDRLHMVPLLPSDALTPVKGQREPDLLGWTSRRFSRLTPCWTGGYTVTDRSRYAFATLFGFGEAPRELAQRSTIDDDGRRATLRWRTADPAHTHTVSFERPAGAPITLDYRIDEVKE